MTAVLGTIWELSIIGIGDPAVPNQERVILRPSQDVLLGQFALGLGIRDDQEPTIITPVGDYVFWFPNALAEPPMWIFVFTGKGAPRETTVTGSNEKALVYHWGRAETVFNFAQLVPVLYRTTDMLIGSNPSRPRFEGWPLKQPQPTKPLVPTWLPPGSRPRLGK